MSRPTTTFPFKLTPKELAEIALSPIDRLLQAIHNKEIKEVDEIITNNRTLVNEKSSLGLLPVNAAIRARLPEIALLLIKKTKDIFDVNATDRRYKTTAIKCAIQTGQNNVLKALLELKNINTKDAAGATMLHLACSAAPSAGCGYGDTPKTHPHVFDFGQVPGPLMPTRSPISTGKARALKKM